MEKRTLRRIIMSLISIFITSIIFATVTFAWLYSNRNVDSLNSNMSLYFDDTTAEYEVFRYDITTSRGTTKDAAGVDLDISNVDLNQYDLIFLKRNRYTPIFARVEITRLQSMPLSGKVYLTVTRTSHDDANTTSASADPMGNYASSVMRFSGWVSQSYDPDPAALYTLIDNELYETIVVDKTYGGNAKLDSDVFTTATGSQGNRTYTKADYITLEMTYGSDDWVSKTINEGTENQKTVQVLNIYLYISYDVELINYYVEEHNMAATQIGANLVEFTNDIDVLRVSYQKVGQ